MAETDAPADAPRWTPVLADRTHLPAIHALYRLIWGPVRSQAYLAWKLFDAPVSPIPPVLAMDGDVCVGVYAVIATPLVLDGQKVMGAQSVDTMTHPAYRRQNMSVTLARFCYAEAARRGFALVYGLPNSSSYPMFMKKLDWRHVDEMVRHVRPLSAPSRIPRPFAAPLTRLLRAQARLAGSFGPSATVAPVTAATRFVLPAAPAPAARCVVDKSPIWFAWRYGAEPEGRYETLTLGDPARPDALIVFDRVSDDADAAGRSLLRIQEWIGITDAARTAALRAVVALAAGRGYASVFLYTNDPAATALLKQAWFFGRGSLPLCLGALGAFDGQEPRAPGDMVVLGGDKD